MIYKIRYNWRQTGTDMLLSKDHTIEVRADNYDAAVIEARSLLVEKAWKAYKSFGASRYAEIIEQG